MDADGMDAPGSDPAGHLARIAARTAGLHVTAVNDIAIDAAGSARSETADPWILAEIDRPDGGWPQGDGPAIFRLSLGLRHDEPVLPTAKLYLDFGRGLSERTVLFARTDGRHDIVFFLILTDRLERVRIDPVDAAAGFTLRTIEFAPVEDRAELTRLVAALGADRVQTDCAAALAAAPGDRIADVFADALQASMLRLLRENADPDTAVTLMCGPVLLGALGERAGTPGADPWDPALADFARLAGIRDLAVLFTPPAGDPIRHPLSAPSGVAPPVALALRNRLAPMLRLVDLWFAGRRDLSLRFEGVAAGLTLDAWQCAPGDDRPVKLLAGAPLGGSIAIVGIALLNPFAPLLLVVRDASGAIRAFDHLPFPSLARNGLHSAERDICGAGIDDLADTAAVSADLLATMRRRHEHRERTVATIAIDPAVHRGTEPILDETLLDYLAGMHGVAVRVGAPDAQPLAAQMVGRQPATAMRHGTTLRLPADSVPTLSALIRPIQRDTPAQAVTGGSALIDWDRQGAVRSIWVPPVGPWLDALQPHGARQVAPLLEIAGEPREGPALSLPWPLAIALRDPPVAMGRRPPFEIASETPLPLLRDGGDSAPVRLSVVLLANERPASPLPLLESIVRQQGVADDIELLFCRVGAAGDAATVEAVRALFPDRHRFVAVPRGAGRNAQLDAVRGLATRDTVLIVDPATILTDPRTVATLAAILRPAEVATAGCLVRLVRDDKPLGSFGGYGLAQADLRAAPGFVFAPLDLCAIGAPATLPVAANAMTAMAMRRETFAQAGVAGSDVAQPALDDILHGLDALRTGLNLCTSAVSVHSERPVPALHQLACSVPYRLDATTLDRLVRATTIVQTIR